MNLTLRALSIWFFSLLTAACSNTGFNSERSASLSLASTSADKILRLENIKADSSDNRIAEIAADIHILNGEISSLFWDHVFDEDLIFCQQTSNIVAQKVVFLCPSEGKLKVTLTVTFTDGEVYEEQLDIDLSGSTNPLPINPPSTELTGAELYMTYCIGCHGALATSQKRGMSLSQFNNGLNTVATMAALKGILNTEQRQKIVDALK